MGKSVQTAPDRVSRRRRVNEHPRRVSPSDCARWNTTVRRRKQAARLGTLSRRPRKRASGECLDDAAAGRPNRVGAPNRCRIRAPLWPRSDRGNRVASGYALWPVCYALAICPLVVDGTIYRGCAMLSTSSTATALPVARAFLNASTTAIVSNTSPIESGVLRVPTISRIVLIISQVPCA